MIIYEKKNKKKWKSNRVCIMMQNTFFNCILLGEYFNECDFN